MSRRLLVTDEASIKCGRSFLMQELQPMERGEKDRGPFRERPLGGREVPQWWERSLKNLTPIDVNPNELKHIALEFLRSC